MLEKVNMYHPDKLADRIAGAIVDLAYKSADRPRIAVEVLIGHGTATVIVESSVTIDPSEIAGIVLRIAGISTTKLLQVPQDPHLSQNQEDKIRCGDNGVFTARWNPSYSMATYLAKDLGERFPFDGKYLFDFEKEEATICQSNASKEEIAEFMKCTPFHNPIINPLGDWTGGPNTDAGCTNRKLGSDQPYCNPNGLHGKDLSKADVSVSIYINAISKENNGAFVKAFCSIGDEDVTIDIDGTTLKVPFETVVSFAREYVNELGGFEKFAEYGVI